MLIESEGARSTGRPTPAEALNLLIAGRLGLHELPPLLFRTYVLAYDDGRTSLLPELDRLNAECDRLYLLAADPHRGRRIADELAHREHVLKHRRRLHDVAAS